jgi:CubicO group peptidase (beta-lactamase class C family)
MSGLGDRVATGMSRRAGWSLLGHRRGHAAVSFAGGAPRPGWRWIAVVVVACLLAAGCSGGGQQPGRSTATTRPAAVAAQRDYWPTAGWRTAPPAAVGMDPKLVADLDAKAAYHPQLRSLLVIRHGELVYERYWHGDAHTGQEAFSVTKSFTAALVGIALGDHQLKSLHQTVGALLARHLPAGADPRLVKVTVAQLLTMTSGLAGDDPTQGGDSGLMQRLHQSRDWVRHILGRKLATTPGTTFAYSNASSHLLSAIVADATGQSTLAFARAKLFGPLGIATENALELTIRHGRRPRPSWRLTSRQRWPGPETPRATTSALAGCGCPPGPGQVRVSVPQPRPLGRHPGGPGRPCGCLDPAAELPVGGSGGLWLPVVGDP